MKTKKSMLNSKNKFYREYKLKRALPENPIGTILKWDLWIEKYTDVGDCFGNKPEAKIIYDIDFVEERLDWFEPVGEPQEFYPKFPSRKEFFGESGHAYIGEFSHNDMCRTCQLIRKLDIDKKLEDAMYETIKEEYNKKFRR